MDYVGFEYQLPIRQLFDVGRVDPFNRLFQQLSPYHGRQLGVDELVQLADKSVFVLAAIDLDSSHRGMMLGITRLVMERSQDGQRQGAIHDTIVDVDSRGKGIGKKLMQKAIEEARVLGYRSIELHCKPARIAANQLYQSLGFKLVTAADPNIEGDANHYRLAL